MSEINNTINKYVAWAENLSGQAVKIKQTHNMCVILLLFVFIVDISFNFSIFKTYFINEMGIIPYMQYIPLALISVVPPLGVGMTLKFLMNKYKKLLFIVCILILVFISIYMISIVFKDILSMNVDKISINYILGENKIEKLNSGELFEIIGEVLGIFGVTMTTSVIFYQTSQYWKELKDCELALKYIDRVRSTYGKEATILDLEEFKNLFDESNNVSDIIKQCQLVVLAQYVDAFEDIYTRYENSKSSGNEKDSSLEEKLSRFNEALNKVTFQNGAGSENK